METEPKFPKFLKIKFKNINKLTTNIPDSFEALEEKVKQFFSTYIYKENMIPEIKFYSNQDAIKKEKHY